jgi:very-short-patch-repair endonuclease
MKSFEQQVVDLYVEQNKSTYEIAKQLETYPNKVRRTLLKLGHTLKDKSAAQKAALEAGRSSHPTAGKIRTDEEKIAISQSLVDYWENMSKKERKRRVSMAKDNWKNMSAEAKETMRSKGIAAIRAAAKNGSKMEQFVKERLEAAGFRCEQHKMIIPAENLEIDLYIPALKTIIEVDGPSHFLPIWGEEKLQKQINADLRKSGALLSKGYAVIRLKSLGQESLAKREQMIERLLSHVNQISDSFPPKTKRFIEVE